MAILKSARTGIGRTRLMYRSNLNHDLLVKYLELLIWNDLLTARGESVQVYATTERGLGFLKSHRELRQYEDLALRLKDKLDEELLSRERSDLN